MWRYAVFVQYALRKYTSPDPGRVYGVEISHDEEKVLLLNNATLPEVGRCVLTSVQEHLAGTNSGSEFQLEITKCGTTGWIVYWNGAEINVLKEWLNGSTLDKGERAYLVSVLSEYILGKHNRLPLYSYEPSALAHLLKTYQHKVLVNSGQKGRVIGAKGDEIPSDAKRVPGYYKVILVVEDEDSGKWLYRNVDEVVPTFDEEKS